ncbi:MAG: type II secretion system secretin GspD [Pseudomonadota bacterium]
MKRLLAATAIAALALTAPPPIPGRHAAVAQQYLNLRDADIRAFIEDAARVTGRTIVIDPAVEGTVSIVSEQPLSRAQYFEVFLETLRANGLVAIPISNGGLRISPSADAAREPDRSGGGRFVTRVIPLTSVSPDAAVSAVTPLISRDGQVTSSGSGNSIVVADYEDNLARIRGLLSEIDRDRSAMRLVTLDNAGAREIATAVAEIGRAGGDAGSVAVVPVDSSNSLVLRGDPARVEAIATIIAQLDSRAALGADVRVYYLEHADAAFLLPVLQQIAGQTVEVAPASIPDAEGNTDGAATEAARAAAQQLAGDESGARAVITRYVGANAIIVSAPPDVQRTLGEVIRQLDTRREQVLVEALIVEVSDNAARELGLQFLLAGTDGTVPFASTNYSNQVINANVLGGAIASEALDDSTVVIDGDAITRDVAAENLREPLQAAAAQQLLNVTGGLFGVGGVVGSAVFGAIVTAVQSDTASNVLSTPSIMMLDNQPGRILVGQEVPITTGEALAPGNFQNAFRTVERRSVGIELDVTPQINSSGAIKLFLKQQVSSVAGPVASGSEDLIFNTREFETTITVDDGDIVAMGGLLDENERRTIEKIPFLGDIPLIGELFKARSRAKQRTNLIVFIRPRILSSREDAQLIAAQRYDFARAQQVARDPDIEPSLDRVLRTYLDALPPGSVPSGTATESLIAGYAVEVAAFEDADEAREFAADLRRFGRVEIVERADTNVVRLGPVPDMKDAEALAARLAAEGYGAAVIDLSKTGPERVVALTGTYAE